MNKIKISICVWVAAIFIILIERHAITQSSFSANSQDVRQSAFGTILILLPIYYCIMVFAFILLIASLVGLFIHRRGVNGILTVAVNLISFLILFYNIYLSSAALNPFISK